MKRIVFVVFLVFVVVLLLLIYFIITKSRFGAGLGGTARSIDDKYKVEINFNYQNPESFGANNANFKCIILYLERVGDLGETVSYDKNVLPNKTDIFSNNNIFYTEYYNNFINPVTQYKIYRQLFIEDTQPDSMFIKKIDTNGSEIEILYDRLGLINVINSGSEPDTVSAYYDMLDDYIYNYIPFCSTGPAITGAAQSNFPILTIEVDTNDTIILCDNKKSNQPSEQVYLKTVSTDNFFKLYLSPGQYKFGVAIVNDRSTIQTDDYKIFPYTISDFTLTDTLLQVNGEFAPSNSESATGLSAVIEYIEDTTPPDISNISFSNISDTSATFTFTSNEKGKVFTLAKISSEPAPSINDIINQQNMNTISSTTPNNTVIQINNLTQSTNYILYSVFQDTNSNYSEKNTKTFSTISTNQSILNNISVAIKDRINKNQILNLKATDLYPSIYISGSGYAKLDNERITINGLDLLNDYFYPDVVDAINNYNNKIRNPPLGLIMPVIGD